MVKLIKNITWEQHQILVGILLGDGHLELSDNKKSVRLRVCQSSEHRFYVEHLYKKFSDWSLGPIRDRERNGRVVCEFDTPYTPSLLPYHKLFYNRNKKKVIPMQSLSISFTSRSLMYLYMDDGGIKSKDSKGVYINTYEYTKQEQQEVCNLLNRNFGLETSLAEDRKSFRIFLSGNSFETLIYLFKPYFIDDFGYKIPPPRKTEGRKKPISEIALKTRAKEETVDSKQSIDIASMPFFCV